MCEIDKNIIGLLRHDMVVDITTRGRKTSLARRIEIWAHYLQGRIFLASRPGHRSWYANLIDNPEFTFHIKESETIDIPAIANPILAKENRRLALEIIQDGTEFQERKNMVIEDWVSGSCIVEVFLTPNNPNELSETFS
jgi:hypothetical protein